MARRTRSVPAANENENANALPSPLPSPSPTSTVFSPLFDSDIHEAPSSASSWSTQQDPHWPIQHQHPHQHPQPTPAYLFSLLCGCVPGFLRPGPFSSAAWVRTSVRGCRIMIREFWYQIVSNPLNTLGVRYPTTRPFHSYWQCLLDALYWNLMLAIAILGMLAVLALRLFLEVVLFAFTFVVVYLVLVKPYAYLSSLDTPGIWDHLASQIHDFTLLPQSETTWLLDEYAAHHVTNDWTNFQPGTFLPTDPKAALRGYYSIGPPPSPSQAQSETTLTLRGDRVVGVGRVLHRLCQITADDRRICADAPLNISVVYIPAAPINSISSWGLMVNEQLGSELSCFHQLVHSGPGGEFRQTSCYDYTDNARRSRILKLQTKRWRG